MSFLRQCFHPKLVPLGIDQHRFEIRINPASFLVSLDLSRGSQLHSFPPDPNQTINATELKRDKQIDNITDAARPVTRSAKSQSPTLKFVKKPTPIPAPRRRNHNVARHEAARCASPHNPREIWTRNGHSEWGNPMLPFVDVSKRAPADEVAVAEPRVDGGRHRRRVGHPRAPAPTRSSLGGGRPLARVLEGGDRRARPLSSPWR
jgi:hypothetical protein